MRAAVMLILAISPLAIWNRMWRETNSQAAARRGTSQYESKRYDPAAKSFAAADKLAPSPRTAFDLGTAQIAAGNYTEGSATMSRAMTDPALRADSLYNRGNSALDSKAYEYAIHDYVETLKLRPGDAQAKRNLEIALERLRSMKQQAGGKQGQQQQSPQQQNQKAPSAGEKEQSKEQEGDAEALLRSVQQQEQEEMQRMKRARVDNARVGW